MSEAQLFSTLPVDIDLLCSQQDIDAVLEVLQNQKGGWITTNGIAAELNWPSQRTNEKIRKIKGELLLMGVPIVESHAGYKIAEYLSEIDANLTKEHQRLQGLHRTIQALEQCRGTMLGQKGLDRW